MLQNNDKSIIGSNRVASGLEKSGKFDIFFKVRELSGNFEN